MCSLQGNTSLQLPFVEDNPVDSRAESFDNTHDHADWLVDGEAEPGEGLVNLTNNGVLLSGGMLVGISISGVVCRNTTSYNCCWRAVEV